MTLIGTPSGCPTLMPILNFNLADVELSHHVFTAIEIVKQSTLVNSIASLHVEQLLNTTTEPNPLPRPSI